MHMLDYLDKQLTANDYVCKRMSERDLLVTTPDDEKVWACYFDSELPVDAIRRCFEFAGHVLFIMSDKLLPNDITDRQSTSPFLRVLHGLGMGRIYVWNERASMLYAAHFDFDQGDISESGRISSDELLCIETGTWLHGWAGTFRIARFRDTAWWTQAAKEQARRTSSSQQSANDAYAQWREQMRKNAKRQRQAYENVWSHGYDYGKTSSSGSDNTYQWAGNFGREQYAPPKPPPQQAPPAKGKRDFLNEFLQCGTQQKAKALWRALAREFHPDVNDADTTQIMQEINRAWDKAKGML